MNEDKNILYVLKTLGHDLEDKDLTIRAKQYTIDRLEKEVEALKERIDNEHHSAEEYEGTIEVQKAYIKNLGAKIYDLEERIAIMTESEIAEEEVIETVNVTRVLEGKKDV